METVQGNAPSRRSDSLSIDENGSQHLDNIGTVHQQSLFRPCSYASAPGDVPPLDISRDQKSEDEIYSKWSPGRKSIIVAILSFCSFLSPVSSTSVLSATPEIASDFHSTGSIVNLSNTGYMIAMAFSPLLCGPISQVFGRRPVAVVASVMFLGFNIGTALAPNLVSFFVFRFLTALFGTAFLLIGSACIGDIYHPTRRGTAMGWFMSGTLIGPAFGPFVGGIVVTFSSWRTIFWLQTALASIGMLGVIFLVPETIHEKKITAIRNSSQNGNTLLLQMINPFRVFRWFGSLNIVLVGLNSSALVWNMYGLLTPIRYVINPRFKLDTPLLGSLFYLAPGIGYLLGTLGGGRWSDWTVRRWMKKRGIRIPEDRLYSVLPWSGVVMPGCIVIYGWTLQTEKGGIPVPVIMMFAQGVAQLFCFPALNTYCLDVKPGQGAEVAAANFFLRYIFGAAATAAVLPLIDAINVGWFCTLSAFLMMASTGGLMVAIQRGKAQHESDLMTN
ncbi:hypothetical protein ACHAPJ_009757 [Fusarium lateritium]